MFKTDSVNHRTQSLTTDYENNKATAQNIARNVIYGNRNITPRMFEQHILDRLPETKDIQLQSIGRFTKQVSMVVNGHRLVFNL